MLYLNGVISNENTISVNLSNNNRINASIYSNESINATITSNNGINATLNPLNSVRGIVAIGNAQANGYFVTPEMFGAIGDGVADDTEALQKALDSGFNVYGNGLYRIGEKDKRYYYPLSINVSNIEIRGRFIDNRTYTTLYNNKDYGVFFVNGNNIRFRIEVFSENDLPIDDEVSLNLSEVAGYAITMNEGCESIDIDLKCSHMNGINAIGNVKNCNVNLECYWVGYPTSALALSSSTINVTVDSCHRAFWGSLDSCTLNVMSKNFYSTGDSGHILLLATNHNGKIQHCNNSIINVIDTGSTIYNDGAPYVSITNDIEVPSIVNANITLIGDISNSNNCAFWLTHDGDVSGSVSIRNQMSIANGVFNRWYNSVSLFLDDCVKSNCTIDTTNEVYIACRGLAESVGNINITHISSQSKISISNYLSVVNTQTTPQQIDTYHFFVVNNVFTFNPATFVRCTYNGIRYLNGVPID